MTGFRTKRWRVTPRMAQRVRVRLSRLFGATGPILPLVQRNRLLFGLVLCSTLCTLSFSLAFVLRFELSVLDQAAINWHTWWTRTLPLVVLIRLAVFLLFGLHRVSWRFASAHDVIPVVSSVIVSTALVVPAVLFMWANSFPRSVLAIDALLSVLFIAGARFSYRLFEEIIAGIGAGKREKVIIVGAGAAGNLTVRAMLTRGLVDYWPVAILDDDPCKQGSTIQGVPVLGPISIVAGLALDTGAKAIVMALPTANTNDFYRIIRQCKATGLPLKTIPDLGQILRSSNVVTRISDFRLEDLLRRRPIRPDVPEIQEFLYKRSVLVTGAAGSIGSELCRQIAEQGTSRLICLDKDENGLFRLEHNLKSIAGTTQLEFYLADIRDRGRLDRLFSGFRPDMVFHAAAYKHVPILQLHPVEAVRNNVGGTRQLAELADVYGVDNFLMISTDKAVNPTSVMGATKRIAERIVRARNTRSGTRFCTIRFGNVLGSAGSVVELFQKQIRDGKPVTVTHKDIERYFMTIPEAVHLVLYAATMGQGGETYILDMGEPVKIDKLARQIIQLSGLMPDVDVPIVYTGLRPGEKLFEELWTDRESPQGTDHPGILMAPCEDILPKRLDDEVVRLLRSAEQNNLDGIWDGILKLVPSFQGRTNGAAHIPPDHPTSAETSA